MVFILHRYIFRELFKVFVLTAVALSVIMSLGSLLRPVQEYGVGPQQVFSLLGYFLPITLTFVLPIAALFATSLVYGRIAADNEFDACKASGISPSMLFYPSLVLAIIVAIADLILSFHVVPAYVHRAEMAMKADAKQILFRNIQRQGYYCLPGGQFRIYADVADIKNSGLLSVVIVDTARPQNKKLITAEAATVTFDNAEKKTSEVKVFARNAFQFYDTGAVFFKAISVMTPFESLMAESVKFRKIDQMNAIKLSPITYYPIAVCAWGAYERLTLELLCQDVNNTIRLGGDSFYQLGNNESIVRFTGEKCELSTEMDAIVLSGKVVLFEYDKKSGELTRSYRGEKLSLQLSMETPTRPSTKIILSFPKAIWLERGTEYIKPRYSAQDLSLPDAITEKLGEDVIETAKKHGYIPNPTPRLEALIKEMKRKIRVTLFEIKAEIHSRLVFGIGCISLILIGTGLGIKIRGGHLLTAFGVSSIPAAVLLVFIMAGKNIAKSRLTATGADFGIGFMWLGFIILSIFALGLYKKLQKN